ncbi:hypothetical protein PAPYR_9124 [Paratrimastix pyriformis]|uniref:Uncharacterized protein n=1 Tax=Paratrimastix pyriformis TaxID=342808 RepID=A0ABQ8U960_9EUKA|nr:hypothetical protein PAPYR_9124 [Paratrimastix pyriformis]
MVCRLGVVAALGGGCPQVGVVCLADVSLSPGWTECFASEVGPVWCRKYLPISGPLRCLSDRLVRWKILLWDVADAARSLGERMWPLILVGLVKGSLVIVLSFPGMGLMGAPMPASAQNLRRNGQLWTMSEGLCKFSFISSEIIGDYVGQVKPGPLTPDRLPLCWGGQTMRGVEDNLAKMWQANLTEWYEENPEGDNLKKEENPAVGDNLKKEENPAVGDNLKKEENPAVGDNLKGQRWATSAGWGMDMMEENPKKGDNLKKEENPGVGDNLKGHRWAPSAGWGRTRRKPQGDNLKKKKEENPAEGDNLMREGAEENPGFGKTLMVGWRTMPGMGMRHRLATSGAYYFGSGGWGWLPFCLREVWKGRLARISWMRVIMYAWGDLEGLACQANWNFIVDRLKRWVGMKEGWKRGGLTLTWLNF